MIDVYGNDNDPNLKLTLTNYIIIGIGVSTKVVLYLWCRTIRNSFSASTLAKDHFNDVVMNGCGTIFAVAGNQVIIHFGVRKGGWIDPMGVCVVVQLTRSLARLLTRSQEPFALPSL